ncbi:MAG: prolipoprotein diacylglyceryl transferase [Chlamydiae bacterium RIFCSPHIGHO2_12_FULL_44_59]|nr:MAG: prolipoprotein diacylglyceryl transferase [Chlamydiae bacterium RIFCSPHIGHO2_01_FULL_44_39]OGN57002.1 MAG: prolipoprotein diacylglyceryl transferase [Chlamydiae bacterium RIFCSPHIGHO2_02_FULL_45_9]OGN59568.1 MAG: prolipoprotein diacylglyceryl transferase [Chlamydiae bacterium RIFCSPHIGHO2_12_FULL_44_59]OGN67297.1 MAG: prolipoprotein diacylglyceryl transferase [Chlamydiae bacterium RIFCSPLOWO2_01_FULL_44_52]OGN68741.1 MAG: prolipoprotein diacylglyceryl transferase [Chlamydiae bacterium R
MIRCAAIYWDSNPEVFRIPVLDWPILWYGVFFALSFAIGFPLFVGILTRFWGQKHRAKAIHITDKLTIYMILATIIGARLGHFIFYERPEKYFSNPLVLLQVWGGGLASHGGAIGIIVGLLLFSYRMRKNAPDLYYAWPETWNMNRLALVDSGELSCSSKLQYQAVRGITWIRLLDFIAVPAALGGGFIRIGNFINQEILGLPTNRPWGVVFGHPADHSFPIPRHPVVLYEAMVYFLIFFLLWKMSFKKENLAREGKLIGLFLILVFGARFLIEYLKTEQSALGSFSYLTMGQMLSIPAILAGVFFYRIRYFRT